MSENADRLRKNMNAQRERQEEHLAFNTRIPFLNSGLAITPTVINPSTDTGPISSEKVNSGGFVGLESLIKIKAGSLSAYKTVSKLDLDTDGMRDPRINYESSYQNQTSIDGKARWLNANTANFFVLPPRFYEEHPGIVLGCLGTIVYKGRVAHCIFADSGPGNKYGEASIAVHRALGFEKVRNGRIVNTGISGGVITLIYAGSKISRIPCTQADINRECAPYWAKFSSFTDSK